MRPSKHLRPILAAACAALLLPALPAFAAATISIVHPFYIRPGVDYQLVIEGDNTGLDGERTDGTQWKLYSPICVYDDGSWQYISGVSVSLTGPSNDGLPANEDDFFEDVEMYPGVNRVELPGTLSGRLVKGQGTGPANKIGQLGVYSFDINGYDGEWGVTAKFMLGAVDFLSPEGIKQDVDKVYQTFVIIPPSGELMYELAVTGGSGSGWYFEDETVAVSADPPMTGQGFLSWVGDTAHLTDHTQSATTVVMPANAVHVTATYGEYYTLTVTNGSGSGQYIETQIAQISADPPDTGKLFARWIGDFAYLDDGYEATTTVTMPSADISVTAIYAWAYELTVNSGTGDGLYLYGTVVDIQADQAPTGKLFDLWTGDIGPVAELDQPSTTVEMSNTDVELTATYADVLYTLTVYSGNGSGSYLYGESVQIDADAPPFGQVFSRWIGDVAGVTDVDASITTITMPPSDVEITATYRYRGDLSGPSGVPDGFVGQADLDIILDAWGDSVPPGDPRADITGPQGVPDGFVGQADLDVVLDDWGMSS